MENSNSLYNPDLKPHAIEFMRSFLRFFLELSQKSPNTQMAISTAAQANDLLLALDDKKTTDEEIIRQYKSVLRTVIQGKLCENTLLTPLVVSVEKQS
jgi:hypothetical protein